MNNSLSKLSESQFSERTVKRRQIRASIRCFAAIGLAGALLLIIPVTDTFGSGSGRGWGRGETGIIPEFLPPPPTTVSYGYCEVGFLFWIRSLLKDTYTDRHDGETMSRVHQDVHFTVKLPDGEDVRVARGFFPRRGLRVPFHLWRYEATGVVRTIPGEVRVRTRTTSGCTTAVSNVSTVDVQAWLAYDRFVTENWTRFHVIKLNCQKWANMVITGVRPAYYSLAY